MTSEATTMYKKIVSKELVPQQFLANGKLKMLGIIKGFENYISN
jgi:hypothetical protein